jgi:hypothetical protein
MTGIRSKAEVQKFTINVRNVLKSDIQIRVVIGSHRHNFYFKSIDSGSIDLLLVYPRCSRMLASIYCVR